MDAIEAIMERRSVRAFKPDPVPRDILEKIMQAALRAPSWENTQPWEFAVVGGEEMVKLRKAIQAKQSSGAKPNLDIPWPRFSGIYKEREKKLAKEIRQALGLAGQDSSSLRDWWVSMTQFFGAPHGIISFMDDSLGEWSLLDMGLALENLLIAAWHYGIGTCVISAGVIYPDVVRDVLSIPKSKRIIVGVALGYPDISSPKATFRSGRESPDVLVTWHGFS